MKKCSILEYLRFGWINVSREGDKRIFECFWNRDDFFFLLPFRGERLMKCE